jgi:hypothetical protein
MAEREGLVHLEERRAVVWANAPNAGGPGFGLRLPATIAGSAKNDPEHKGISTNVLGAVLPLARSLHLFGADPPGGNTP